MAKDRTVPPAERDRDSTADLLVRSRSGDRSAEDEIIRRHLPALRRWARGRLPRAARTSQDTEDLVQDTFVHALRRLAAFEPSRTGALQAYLRVAVGNRLKDEMRRLARRPLAEHLEESADRGPTPLEAAVAAETGALYRRALHALRPVDRALVRARVDREWDYATIARAFGKPTPDAARMAVRRAMRRLFVEMRGEGKPATGRRPPNGA
jgi:RNA polymerase sigma-70 factor (ECF subfamily)